MDYKQEEIYLFFMPGYDEEYLLNEKNILFNNHHAFAKTLKRNVAEKYPLLLKAIDFSYIKRMPAEMHSNHNKSFAGDFLPHEVLGRLLKMFNTNFYFYNDQRKEIIKYIFNAHVHKYKRIEFNIEAVEAKLYDSPNNYWRINLKTLFDLFKVDIIDAVNYLEEYFFHPAWRQYDIELMIKLSGFGHNGDRQKKLNCIGHFDYFMRNKHKLEIRIKGEERYYDLKSLFA